MEIHENMTCERCNVTYRGVFRVTKDGVVECGDCSNKEFILGELEYLEKEKASSGVVQEIVKELLNKDINRIYFTTVEEGKDVLNTLRDSNGDLDMRKVFFQNNSIDLVLSLHENAYKALTYMELGEGKKYTKFAEKIYNYYIESREKRYSEEEVLSIKNDLNSEIMAAIVVEVEV